MEGRNLNEGGMHVCELNRAGTCVLKCIFYLASQQYRQVAEQNLAMFAMYLLRKQTDG